jgi:hypothetical protein
MEPIGWALRQLSLSGNPGNVFAIILYIIVGLIPVLAWLLLKCKGKNRKVDNLLFPLGGFLLIVLYYMINPGLIQVGVAGSGKMLLGGTFYSLLAGYLVLRVLSMSKTAETTGLHKGLRILLYVVILVFIYSIAAELLVYLPKSLTELREANSAAVNIWGIPDAGLVLTYLFVILKSLIGVLPYVMNVFLLILGVRTIDLLIKDTYSKDAVKAIRKIGNCCRKTLGIIVITGASFNVLQLIVGKLLYQIQITVGIPVFSILFVVAILVIVRYVEENQKLKQDNDLFI